MKEQLELLKDYLWYQYAGDIFLQKWFEESPFTIELREHFGIEFYKLSETALNLKYNKGISDRLINIANRARGELKFSYDERDKLIDFFKKEFADERICVGALHFSKIKSFTLNQDDKGNFTSVELNNFKFRLEKPKV